MKGLEYYDIRGKAHDWLHSYLPNRKPFLMCNNILSQMETASCGAPQRSVLGPLLFIMYVNDLCRSVKLVKVILFAGDSTVFGLSPILPMLIENANAFVL